MQTLTQCVICGGEIQRRRSALVAPFLSKRIWDREPFSIDLVECKSCGFLFYNPRLEADEEARLYRGYRSPEYQQMRQSFEPWYTSKMNADLASPESYRIRRGLVQGILREHLNGHRVTSVLDFGGDRGDLVNGLIEGAKAYVYEISGIAPAAGVIAVTDPLSCKADLVINSNVLEHTGFPRQLTAATVKCAPLVYLEVPSESPFEVSRLLRRTAQSVIAAAYRPSLARHLLRPSALYTMHEHINYFTERSISMLLESCGCRLIASGTYPVTGAYGGGFMAWCLGAR